MSTVSNGYCTKDELKSYLSVTHPDADESLTVAINAASRAIDAHCQRRFYSDTAVSARTFPVRDPYCVKVHDFSTTTGLIVATDYGDDGTYETTWTITTDFDCRPVNGIRGGLEGWPFFELHAVGGKLFPLSYKRYSLQVTAMWGWSAVPPMVKDACLIWASRLYKRSASPEGIFGGFESDPIRLSSRIDPDVGLLLNPYCIPVA